jgi:ABC-2 type transport system permease protein
MIVAELRKLLSRPRMWLSVALLCLLPAVVAVFLSVSHLTPPPGQGAAFLSAVVSNGTLYPAAALALVLPIFLPLAVAVVAGDSVAGEAGYGMLRYLLARPVGRTRLLVAKLISVSVFTVLAVAMVVVTSLAVGVALFGVGTPAAVGQPGQLTSLSGVPLTPPDLIARLLGAIGFVVLAMLAVGAIALFLSTLTTSSLGATLGTLAVLITSQVLVTLDAAAPVKPYLLTGYWLSWIDFFRDPIFLRSIDRGVALNAVYIAVLLAAAWANFATKDITT